MKLKGVLVYFVSILIGLSFLYVSNYYYDAVRESEREKLFPDVAIESVNRLLVKREGPKGFSFDINRKGRVWVIKKENKNITANQGRVKRVLSDIARMSILSVLSRDSNKFAKYGVDKASAVYIEGFSGDKSIFSLFVGGVAQDYSNSFVLKQESPKVLLVDTSIAKDMSKFRWKESKVIDIERSLVKRFTYRLGMGRIYSFYKSDNSWHEDNLKDKLNRNKTWYLLNSITDLTIKKNSTPGKSSGFDNPLISVTIEAVNGLKDGFIIGKANKNNNTFYVRRISDAHIFEVPVYKVNGINIKDEEFVNG